MSLALRRAIGRVRRLILSLSFWLVAAMLLSGVLLHYTSQLRALPLPVFGDAELTRHATERVLLILPIGYAAFALSPVAGLLTLTLAFLIMLPRVIFLSPHPADALLEVLAVSIVGGLTIWLAWIRQNQERLRQQATARLRAVNTVSAVLTASLELRRMLGEALDAVLEVTGLEAGCVLVLNEKENDLILFAQRGLPPGLRVGARGLRFARALAEDPALTSQVALLLRSKGRPQGALIVGRSGVHHFEPEEVNLLTAIATHMGVATENARLHRAVARQLVRERRLGEIAKEVASELELDKVLSKVVQIAEELAGADAGAIALLDEQTDTISYPYLHNMPEALTQLTVPRTDGLAGQVIATGLPMVIEDYAAHPARVEQFVQGGIQSTLAVPIVSGEKVFGALGLFTLSEKRTFSERNVSIVSAVARQAAVAIENARLYDTMRSYARQILSAQEAERTRMARELHDDTAQTLVVLTRKLDALLDLPDPGLDHLRRRCHELRQLTADISHGVRRFIQDLRPSILDDLGLLPALSGLTERLSEEDGIEARVEVLGGRQRLPVETELVLFRIAQEALNNVRKHSQATEVVTTVEFGDGAVTISIRDNGRGFKLPSELGQLVKTGKLGLTGMFERAQLAGGTLTLESHPGEATTVVAQIPYQQ